MAKKNTQDKPFGSRLDHLSPLIQQVAAHKPVEQAAPIAAPVSAAEIVDAPSQSAEPPHQQLEATPEREEIPSAVTSSPPATVTTAPLHIVDRGDSHRSGLERVTHQPITATEERYRSPVTHGAYAESAGTAPAYQPAPTAPPQFNAQSAPAPSGERVRENMVRILFNVPESDYQEFQDVIQEMNRIIGPGIDMAHVARGLITRFITARRELLDAARDRPRIKRPNTRNPREVAEVDNCMAEIEAMAFRRAKPPVPR